MIRHVPLTTTGLVLFGALWLAAAASEARAEGDGTHAPAISVAEVRQAAFTETILVTGSLIAREEVLVSPQIDGYRITEVRAEEGDRVERGQVLARLDSSTLEAQLAQLQASLVRAEAAIAQANSRIIEAEATRKQAEAAFTRAKELRRSGTTSQSIYDEREAAAHSAVAQLASTRDGLRLAQAEHRQIEAQVHESQMRLGYAEIKAPAAGVISRRTARVGATATAGADPLFRIVAKGEIELDAEIPEIYMPRLAAGMAARIDIAGLEARTGTIRLIASEVERTTRLGRVRIFIGDDPALRVGTFARGLIDIAASRGLGVPAAAVLRRPGGTFVQVVRDGKVATRPVSTGLSSDGLVEITAGLAEGELVVAKSGTLLRDGDLVRPVLTESTAVSEAR